MSEFEDNLWHDVVREHGDDLDQMNWPPPRRRRPRPRVLAGTSAVLAAAVGALVLVLGGAGTTPAFAVTTNHDGSITLSITRLNAIHAANVKLSSLGVRAMAVQVPVACRAALTAARFNPRRIPVGKTLVIAAWRDGHQVRLSSAKIGRAGVAACLSPARNWTVDQQVLRPGAGGPCTVYGRAVPPPQQVLADGGASTGTGTTNGASTGTGTGTTQSTGTGTTNGASTGTGTTQSTGTGTGTGTTGTGTAAAVPSPSGPPQTVVIPCGYQQRIQGSPQQLNQALALVKAARKNYGKDCSVTIEPAPQRQAVPGTGTASGTGTTSGTATTSGTGTATGTATASGTQPPKWTATVPSTRSGEPGPVTVVRCQRRPSK